MASIVENLPCSLKAVVFQLCESPYNKDRDLNIVDEWYEENKAPEKRVVLVSRYEDDPSDKIDRTVSPWNHRFWGKIDVRVPLLYQGLGDWCEELIEDGRLTLWERADGALAARGR
jgi:hypothetical protein